MSDDLISRQAAIGEMRDMYHAAEKWGKEASDDVIKARAESCMASLIEMKLRIENLPSAQSEQQWVSVTDKLPDFGISVLLNEGYSYAVGYLIKTTEGKYEWGINGWYNDLEDWSAWMPLPELYREETEDDND